MPIAGVVADASVLLSAVVGGAALRVLTEFDIVVHAAHFNTEEVAEYLPYMARKYGLRVEIVEMQWKLLPLRVHPMEDYRDRLQQAVIELKRRDPEDAHPLALARSLALPIWSNDRDLSGLDVECYSTARLLRVLSEQNDLRK